MPIVEENTYIIDIEYSPLIGGFAIVLNDGRAAFLTASSLRFDPNVRINDIETTNGHLFSYLLTASSGYMGSRYRGCNMCHSKS